MKGGGVLNEVGGPCDRRERFPARGELGIGEHDHGGDYGVFAAPLDQTASV